MFNRRYRGHRAVQAGRPSRLLWSLGNGALVVFRKFDRPTFPTRARVDKHSRPCVVSISVPRCAEAVGGALTFDSMNVFWQIKYDDDDERALAVTFPARRHAR